MEGLGGGGEEREGRRGKNRSEGGGGWVMDVIQGERGEGEKEMGCTRDGRQPALSL